MRSRRPVLLVLASLLGSAACASAPPADGASGPTATTSGRPLPSGPVTVQAGAPGEASTRVDASNIAEMGGVSWVEEDVRFMQGMIPHHAQALQMTALVREKSADPGVRRVALRMEISQRDEIAMMRRWLMDRDRDVPASAALVAESAVQTSLDEIRSGSGAAMEHGAMDHGDMDHAGMDHGGMEMMPGMLTPDELRTLASAESPEFERLFLEFMIRHHEGAITMVDRLFATDGAGQESEMFQFASHIDADQRAEIARMRAMLEARLQPRIP